MKLQLPSVTLVLVDCLEVDRSIKVVEHCKRMCDFGAVKFLTSLDTDYEHAVQVVPLKSLIAYSIFCLTRLHEYFDTDFVLVIQRDGFILNPNSWRDEWYGYDFIGGLFMQLDRVGSGGFSLRSKRIMQEVSKVVPEWDGTIEHANEIQRGLSMYEDGELSLTSFAKQFNIAPNEEGCIFSQAGNRNPKYFIEKPFGFHRTFQQIDFTTGIVDSADITRDVSNTYDHEIDKLK